MIRFVLAACLLLELCACSTVSSMGSYFDRHYRIRENNVDYVTIEYDTEHFSDAEIMEKANSSCNAYAKTGIFNRSYLEPSTGRRVSTYRCLTQSERRAREEAEKAGEPVPLRRQ